jgi:hypothetical protein
MITRSLLCSPGIMLIRQAAPTSSVRWGHRARLDDFGPNASFDVLNSYSTAPIKRGTHRILVDTLVPLGVRNFGLGFTHYAIAPSTVP